MQNANIHNRQPAAQMPQAPFARRALVLLCVAAFAAPTYAGLDSTFTASPLKSHALNWYWLNASLSNAQTDFQLTALRDSCGFSGIVPCFGADNWFDNPSFAARLHHMMDKCDELGMRACVNDDYFFPSGPAKGAMNGFPEFGSRSISKTEQDVTGPSTLQRAVPGSILMGCVAMNNNDHSVRSDITASVTGTTLTWNVPAGSWKVMMFTLSDPTGGTNFLNREAVQKWISLTYQKLYDALPGHYGSTVHSQFFDDVGCGDCWTRDFNTKFQAVYGVNPVVYYPALWYDIGPNTAAARNMLFGFRNDLFSTNFGGTVAKWCADHGVEAAGHYASVNITDGWLATCGDPIKFFKHTQQVGTEGWKFMSVAYKIQSSACYLYDKPLLVNQNYALIWDFEVNDLYRLGMESFANGVTTQYADGAQNKDPADPDFMRPELSWRNPQCNFELPAFTKWTGRCQMLLQGGRHVADIALLFPIAAYLGETKFGPDLYASGTSDYAKVADSLSHTIRRDYTFMHPEVLDSNCTIDATNHTINLNNRVNYEKYKVLIIPGSGASGAIHLSTMKKAKEFYDNGGAVISTLKLPCASAELGQDTAVIRLVRDIFGLDAKNPGLTYKKNTNASGGRAYFMQDFTERVGGVSRLQYVLDDAVTVWDVKFTSVTPPPSQPHWFPFSYLHKVLNNADYYYFANSTGEAITSQVRLRGKLTPRLMDPHTGAITNATFQNTTESGQDVTVVTFTVGATKSLFIGTATPAAVGFRGAPPKSLPEGNKQILLRTSRSTTIRLGAISSINAGQKLRMDIFGMDGRRVSASEHIAGSGTVAFTLGEGVQCLTFGTYVCRITTAGFERAMAFTVTR